MKFHYYNAWAAMPGWAAGTFIETIGHPTCGGIRYVFRSADGSLVAIRPEHVMQEI